VTAPWLLEQLRLASGERQLEAELARLARLSERRFVPERRSWRSAGWSQAVPRDIGMCGV
jgi:hypothetical protein